MKAYRVNFKDDRTPQIYAAASTSRLLAHCLNDRPVGGASFADQFGVVEYYGRSAEYDAWAKSQKSGSSVAENKLLEGSKCL
jgi:hypothetical protein